MKKAKPKNAERGTLAQLLCLIEACAAARRWARGKTLEQAWKECDNADWMQTLISTLTPCFNPDCADCNDLAEACGGKFPFSHKQGEIANGLDDAAAIRKRVRLPKVLIEKFGA